MLFPRPLKTSVLFVPERKASDTLDLVSTVSFLASCAKEETSPTTTEREENLSTETSLPMKTSPSSTPDPESWVWPTVRFYNDSNCPKSFFSSNYLLTRKKNTSSPFHFFYCYSWTQHQRKSVLPLYRWHRLARWKALRLWKGRRWHGRCQSHRGCRIPIRCYPFQGHDCRLWTALSFLVVSLISRLFQGGAFLFFKLIFCLGA